MCDSVILGHVTLPHHWYLRCCSLDGNALCGLYTDVFGRIQGTFTIEGINALCEGLEPRLRERQVLLLLPGRPPEVQRQRKEMPATVLQ